MPDTYTDTTTTNFDKTVVALIQKRLEEELRGNLVHLQDAVKGAFMPGTNLMRYVAYRDLDITTGTPSPGTAPWLTQGETPDVEDLSISYDEMAAYQAGRLVGVSDVALSESPHALAAVAAERVAFNMRATIDKYMADTILAGTAGTIFSAASGSNTDTSGVAAGDTLTGLDIKKAVKVLASAAVPKFADGYYHAIIHPAAVYGLQSDTAAGGWMDANKYTDNRPLLTGEIGRYAGVRFMETPYAGIQADSGTSSIDVYSTVVYGPNAFAFGDLQTARVYAHSAPDKADPLNQRFVVGWKAMFGAILLDSNGARYVRIESAGA